MLGSRSFLENHHAMYGNSQNGEEVKIPLYLQDLLIKTKKISQIIAYIWCYNHDETSAALDKYFKQNQKLSIKALLTAQKGTEEYKLLEKIFNPHGNHPEYLPIFTKEEIDLYEFQVVLTSFEGSITDIDPRSTSNALLQMNIPYPPRPTIGRDSNDEDAPVQEKELEDWLKQPPNEYPYFCQDNPYIPTSCS